MIISGKKDIDEIVDELESLEKVEGTLEKIEHKIMGKLSFKHKFKNAEEAINDALKKHHHHEVEIENIYYTVIDNTVYVVLTLNNSITPITRLNMAEDIKGNLLACESEFTDAIVNFYLDGSEDFTECEIAKWTKIK